MYFILFSQKQLSGKVIVDCLRHIMKIAIEYNIL